MATNCETPEFLTVDEAAEILKTTAGTLYTYLCNSGSKNGKKRSRLSEEIYVKFGRKTLFIKPKLIEWVLNGAQMV